MIKSPYVELATLRDRSFWIVVAIALILLAIGLALLACAPVEDKRWEMTTSFFLTASVGGAIATALRWWETGRAEQRRAEERAQDLWRARQALIRDIFVGFCATHSAYKKVRRLLTDVLNRAGSTKDLDEVIIDGLLDQLNDAQLDCEMLKHQCKPLKKAFTGTDAADRIACVGDALGKIEVFLNDVLDELMVIRWGDGKIENSSSLQLFVGPSAKLSPALFEYSTVARDELVELLAISPPPVSPYIPRT